MAEWLEIAIATPRGGDEIGALIQLELAAARSGTEVRSDEVVFWVEVADGETVLAETRAAIARLAADGFDVDPTAVRARPAKPESEWRDAWKIHFRTARLTRQLVVVPSWEQFQPAADDLVIDLDPGQAFGTGAHGSTRLVLLALQAARDAGAPLTRFLDVGTGSGILAIAAVKLWPDAVAVAIDNDPLAVAAATENCAKNRVSSRVTCAATPVAELNGAYQLVAANIQADVLTELAPAIAARVAASGQLILSGLLDDQVERVADHYAALPGFRLDRIERSQDDREFCCAVLVRQP